MTDKKVKYILEIICCAMFYVGGIVMFTESTQPYFEDGTLLLAFLAALISGVALPMLVKAAGETKKQKFALMGTVVGAELYVVGLFCTEVLLWIGVLFMLLSLGVVSLKR